MKKVFFIFLLLLVWALIFVSTMPMQFALDKIQLPQNMQISHLRGSIWSGGAHINYQQNMSEFLPATIAADFAWQLCPGWQRGLLVVCMEVNNPDFNIAGMLAYRPWHNRLLLRDTAVDFSLAYFNIKIPIMNQTIEPQANVRISIKELWIDPLTGASRGDATGLVQKLDIGFIELGDYSLRANLDNKTMRTDYAGQTEDFKLGGSVSINFATRQYDYNADILLDNIGFFEILRSYAQSVQGKKLTFTGAGVLPF